MKRAHAMRVHGARLVLALTLVAGAAPFVGCAETSRTEVKRTRTVDPGPNATPGEVEVVEERTTVVQQTDSCDGVLSCTVDFAGDVIAFPIKLVGGIFKVIL